MNPIDFFFGDLKVKIFTKGVQLWAIKAAEKTKIRARNKATKNRNRKISARSINNRRVN